MATLSLAAHQVEHYAENLGEILRGDRIESTLYSLSMKSDEYCKVLCEKKYTPEEIGQFAERDVIGFHVPLL